jgi:hypothetical protein
MSEMLKKISELGEASKNSGRQERFPGCIAILIL